MEKVFSLLKHGATDTGITDDKLLCDNLPWMKMLDQLPFYNTQVTKLEESVAVMGNTLTQLVELVSAKRE